MPDRAVKIELFDQFARVAQALASGRRVEIVDVLANGERTVDELARQVAMSVAASVRSSMSGPASAPVTTTEVSVGTTTTLPGAVPRPRGRSVAIG